MAHGDCQLAAQRRPGRRGQDKGGEMDHATAVRVARSGKGAIVAELLRLSHELQEAQERIERLTKIIEEKDAYVAGIAKVI